MKEPVTFIERDHFGTRAQKFSRLLFSRQSSSTSRKTKALASNDGSFNQSRIILDSFSASRSVPYRFFTDVTAYSCPSRSRVRCHCCFQLDRGRTIVFSVVGVNPPKITLEFPCRLKVPLTAPHRTAPHHTAPHSHRLTFREMRSP